MPFKTVASVFPDMLETSPLKSPTALVEIKVCAECWRTGEEPEIQVVSVHCGVFRKVIFVSERHSLDRPLAKQAQRVLRSRSSDEYNIENFMPPTDQKVPLWLPWDLSMISFDETRKEIRPGSRDDLPIWQVGFSNTTVISSCTA
jgi:hypothetical protein